MKVFAALVLWAGCQAAGGQIDLAATRNCTRTCASCATTCTVPADSADYQAFCGYPCSVTSDCPDPTARCTALPGQTGRVCVTMSSPKLCEDRAFDANYHCAGLGDAQCMGTMILAKPFGFTTNRVCGSEFLFCPTGCNSSVTPNACN